MRPSAMPERRVKLCGACMSPIDAAPWGAAVLGAAAAGGVAFGAGAGFACATAPGAVAGACECCVQAQLAKITRVAAASSDFSASMALDPFRVLVVLGRTQREAHRQLDVRLASASPRGVLSAVRPLIASSVIAFGQYSRQALSSGWR